MSGEGLTAVALLVGIAFGPAVALWLALRVPRVVAVLWARLRPAPPTRPAGPPLEVLVADLRRLHGEIRAARATTRVRRTALLAAYDDVLVAVCRAVEAADAPLYDAITEGGTTAALGPDRALARLRAEAAVQEAGIALDPPAAA